MPRQLDSTTVEHTKSRRVRYVPLSEYGAGWLQRLVRYLDCPFVFVNPITRARWKNPEKAFYRGRKAASLDWVGFHDLRRFRASQWVMRGVNLRTVQELMGHAEIKTTMRYAHLAPNHALNSIRRVQESEDREFKDSGRKAGEGVTGDES